MKTLITISTLLFACSFDGDNQPDPEPDAGIPLFCGDSEINNDEICDDGNDSSLDGCNEECQIEPNFECPIEGEACLAVEGLRWTESTVASIPAPLGVSGAGPFSQLCENNKVLVGFIGAFGADCGDPPQEGIARLQALCSTMSFDEEGEAVRGPHNSGESLGTCTPFTSLNFKPIVCPPSMIVSSVKGNISSSDGVGLLSLNCQSMFHREGSLQRGVPGVSPGTLGTGDFGQESSCPDGRLAVGIRGSAENVLTELGLSCAPLVTVTQGADDV